MEWIGEIPEEWEVKRLKYVISNLESGVSVNATDFPATGSEFGILEPVLKLWTFLGYIDTTI